MDYTDENVCDVHYLKLMCERSECFDVMRRAQRENDLALYKTVNAKLRIIVKEINIRDMSPRAMANA